MGEWCGTSHCGLSRSGAGGHHHSDCGVLTCTREPTFPTPSTQGPRRCLFGCATRGTADRERSDTEEVVFLRVSSGDELLNEVDRGQSPVERPIEDFVRVTVDLVGPAVA